MRIGRGKQMQPVSCGQFKANVGRHTHEFLVRRYSLTIAGCDYIIMPLIADFTGSLYIRLGPSDVTISGANP